MSFFTVEPAPARLEPERTCGPRQPASDVREGCEVGGPTWSSSTSRMPWRRMTRPKARKNIIQAIGDIDWGQQGIVGAHQWPGHPLHYRDVVDVLEQASDAST